MTTSGMLSVKKVRSGEKFKKKQNARGLIDTFTKAHLTRSNLDPSLLALVSAETGSSDKSQKRKGEMTRSSTEYSIAKNIYKTVGGTFFVYAPGYFISVKHVNKLVEALIPDFWLFKASGKKSLYRLLLSRTPVCTVRVVDSFH